MYADRKAAVTRKDRGIVYMKKKRTTSEGGFTGQLGFVMASAEALSV